MFNIYITLLSLPFHGARFAYLLRVRRSCVMGLTFASAMHEPSVLGDQRWSTRPVGCLSRYDQGLGGGYIGCSSLCTRGAVKLVDVRLGLLNGGVDATMLAVQDAFGLMGASHSKR